MMSVAKDIMGPVPLEAAPDMAVPDVLVPDMAEPDAVPEPPEPLEDMPEPELPPTRGTGLPSPTPHAAAIDAQVTSERSTRTLRGIEKVVLSAEL
ncbi:MAG TPA: hypothetical protein VGY54_23335 [Polyangiaceae bacterium]|jgi:hypothetical protein|nr:hypothetical protein [Polyangiaceae bacterium]